MLYVFVLLIFILTTSSANYVNKSNARPWRVRFYPKNSVFRKSDLIDRGCTLFLKACPAAYKREFVCGRHYDGKFKTFNSYCDLEYENCNSWRQWSMVKTEKC